MVCAIAFSLLVFLFVVTFIIMLGAFDDFKDLKLLIPSLPLAVLSLFLMKPLYRFTSSKNEAASNRKTEEECVQKMENGTSDDNQTCMTESSDSDSNLQVLPDDIASYIASYT